MSLATSDSIPNVEEKKDEKEKNERKERRNEEGRREVQTHDWKKEEETQTN